MRSLNEAKPGMAFEDATGVVVFYIGKGVCSEDHYFEDHHCNQYIINDLNCLQRLASLDKVAA